MTNNRRRCISYFLILLIFFSLFPVFTIFCDELVSQDSRIHAIELNNSGVVLAGEQKYEEALSKLEKAKELDPTSSEVLRNLSQTLTDYATQSYKKGSATEAISKLQKAVRYDSKNGPAWFFLGDLYYLVQGDLNSAIDCWKRSLETAPSEHRGSILDRIQKVELDQRLERNFSTLSTAHFNIRTELRTDDEKITNLGQFLESQYEMLSKEFNSTPARISVIVYPKGSFDRLTNRFEWAIGFYDGRIRMREEDLGSDVQKTVLPHEMVHAFLQSTYGSNIPTWVHEGYAQLKEPPREWAPDEVEMNSALKNGNAWIPIKWLDKRFAQPIRPDDIMRAYLEARLIVSFLLERYGSAQFHQFLGQLAKGTDIETAFNQSFSPSRWSRADQGNLE